MVLSSKKSEVVEPVLIIRNAGKNARLNGVLIALDRQEKGKDTELSAIQQVEAEYGVKVVSIVSLSHILAYLEQNSTGTVDYTSAISSIREYRKEWGINN